VGVGCFRASFVIRDEEDSLLTVSIQKREKLAHIWSRYVNRVIPRSRDTMLMLKETDEPYNNKKSVYGRFIRICQKHKLARGLNYCRRLCKETEGLVALFVPIRMDGAKSEFSWGSVRRDEK
jgi:hypothetical protein